MFGGLLRARCRGGARNARRRGRSRRRIGCLGWLLWLAAALILLLILALLVGGWQKGTKAGLAQPGAVPMTVSAAATAAAAYQP